MTSVSPASPPHEVTRNLLARPSCGCTAVCPYCRGSGRQWDRSHVDFSCTPCQGNGWVNIHGAERLMAEAVAAGERRLKRARDAQAKLRRITTDSVVVRLRDRVHLLGSIITGRRERCTCEARDWLPDAVQDARMERSLSHARSPGVQPTYHR